MKEKKKKLTQSEIDGVQYRRARSSVMHVTPSLE